MVSRRQIIVAIGAGTLAPLGAFAHQQRKIWRIGFLKESNQNTDVARLTAFKQGMAALGYVENSDFVIEFRFADSSFERLPHLAAELVAKKVDVIVTSGTPSAVAASKATGEIPIVMSSVGDPMGSGLAASLARPGGNLTGLSTVTTELIVKRLDFFRQLLPRAQRIGLLYDPGNKIDEIVLSRFESTCSKLRLAAIRAPAAKSDEISAAFADLRSHKADGLIVTSSAINNADREKITKLAMTHRFPAIYSQADYGDLGGLISYAPDFTDMNRRAASYVDKILRGAKAGDLPIEQPTKFELVVNMKTAKALGIKIPQAILVQATKVID